MPYTFLLTGPVGTQHGIGRESPVLVEHATLDFAAGGQQSPNSPRRLVPSVRGCPQTQQPSCNANPEKIASRRPACPPPLRPKSNMGPSLKTTPGTHRSYPAMA